MKILVHSVALLCLLWTATVRAQEAGQTWRLASPDGKLAVTARLDGGALQYRIDRGDVEVLGWSPLGITRDDEDFSANLKFDRATDVRAIDETYTILHGKRHECRSLARQQTLALANQKGAKLEVTFRAANDGVAFRYGFPGSGDKLLTVRSEQSGFRVPAGAKAWMTPYSESSMWTPAYEEYYLDGIAVGTPSPNQAGWAFPALFELPGSGGWLLLTEAAVDGAYCGCRLDQKAPEGVYRIRFPDPSEGAGQGDVRPRSRLPWQTPWRVAIVAPTPAGIVESTLVTDLNPPCRVQDTSWIKPGRVAWSWWSDHDSPQNYAKMRPFIDLAAEMGWEYFLVDANWTLMDGGDVRQLADYAKSKGVGLFLWYNSGGEHNTVTEKPRGAMKAENIRKFEFELLRKWGVVGVKIDFFQSDKQNIMALYHDILRDAAEAQIMVNVHGCTVPRGWERTWPHLLSMEAVRGEECYTFAAEYPAKAPAYNTMLPFTRNVVGPMDYTPAAFSDDKYPHLTTNAHELALPIVFESGLLHFADRVSAYRDLPEAPKALLRSIPVAWDETRYISGTPGRSAVLARRSGQQWYVGAINGQDRPARVVVSLDFLGPGQFDAVLIGDGKTPREFGTQTFVVKQADSINMALRPHGGGVIQLSPKQ